MDLAVDTRNGQTSLYLWSFNDEEKCFITSTLGREFGLLGPGKKYFKRLILCFTSFNEHFKFILRRHDTQHNDTQHNDTQHSDTQHNDAQHNDTQHNDT